MLISSLFIASANILINWT